MGIKPMTYPETNNELVTSTSGETQTYQAAYTA